MIAIAKARPTLESAPLRGDHGAIDIDAANHALREATPAEIVTWALSLDKRAIATTSFGVNAAATLHAVVEQAPSLPVIWVDTGFNLRDTYVQADAVTEQLGLNLHVYSPLITAERISAKLGGIPLPEDADNHRWFTEKVKLEPFRRAIADFRPQLWFSGIRAEETDHRRSLDIVSLDHRGIIKVAPFFYWSDSEIDSYMLEHGLVSCQHYFDPTKVSSGRECGLHTSV
ncbi:phosphoadenosine phosphosulfate reductase [Luminiphilus syltensis NOR5-1B]|uniref:Phosphoadenosine phosphosulfate reductase n=1 Tax=Luminiphilus syltensis NOR5-1B TaxID=565045 RepID=B8KW50_9GAMM|nr:phosphoadenosine phosphosulfate reductase family protein [Luminiphilus syltensis]EED34880.1 phosphoadenosine phosphosulfate reductase [Luminiphilus syltensis NOR5-1B]